MCIGLLFSACAEEGKKSSKLESNSDDQELVNKDCYGEGWMLKIELSNPSELNDLMSADEYQQNI